MPFSDTASYFECRAKKARSDDQRREFADAAEFYRALAGIIPTFPDGYRTAALRRSAERLDKRAQECLALADVTRDANCRARLLRLAATYDRVSGSLRAAE